MGRIEDEREDALLAERLMRQKRAEEQQKRQSGTAASQFAKLVQKGQAETSAAEHQALGRGAIARMVEEEQAAAEALGQTHEEASSTQEETARSEESRQRTSAAQKRQGEQRAQRRSLEAAKFSSSHESDRAADQLSSSGWKAERSEGEAQAQGRTGDAATERRRQQERSSREAPASPTHGADGSQSPDEKEQSQRERKAGDQKGGGGQDSKGGQGSGGPGFRLNPALLAPVPVQQAVRSGVSERLRQLANEIAQKIVDRVRVGTTAAGKSEFQIDLKDNVLAGLRIKVSSSNGRISATFSGRDPKVLRMLREQSDQLKAVLASRGLTVESLAVEELA